MKLREGFLRILFNLRDIFDFGHPRWWCDLLEGPVFSDGPLLLWRLLLLSALFLVFIQDICGGLPVSH